VPYIIENVVGAYMPGSVICCGSDLCSHVRDNDGVDLFLKRHRQFESNIELEGSACFCISNKVLGMKIGGVYGGGSRDRAWAENVRHGGYTPSKTIQEKLMGIDWMTQKELNQAIPPAYTEYIGLQLMAYLENGKTAENMQGREL
jgi:DNA (cytosine-5)-methyltransferase 1